MRRRKKRSLADGGPDREVIERAYQNGVKAYISTRKRKLPAFIRRHYGWKGSFRRNSEAFGWDLLKTPVNLVWSPVISIALLLEKGCEKVGWKEGVSTLKYFKKRWPGFTTAVEQETERLVYTELLELPQPGTESDSDEARNALFETILDQPEISDWIEETIATIKTRASTRTYQKNVKAALKELDRDRRFAIELLTDNHLARGGGSVEIGTAIAAAMAQNAAINSFWAGPVLGKLWYGTFATASASLGVTLGCITGVAAIYALISAVSGMVTDPILNSFGTQKKRLSETLNALEKELKGTADGAEETSEAFIESLIGLVKMIYSVAEDVEVIENDETKLEDRK